MWKNIKKLYGNNRFKISGTKRVKEFKLPDGSYFISNIQCYFEYIIKKHEKFTDKSPVEIYVNKIQNRITFRIKAGYYLKILTPTTMKLLRSTEGRQIDIDKYSENVLQLEITEVGLKEDSRVIYRFIDSGVHLAFVPNKSFGQLLNISPKNYIYSETFHSESS